MLPTLKNWLHKPIVIFFLLVILIVVIDELVGGIVTAVYHNNGWQWGSFTLYQRGLTFAPALNGLIQEVWFAETVALIFMPLLLYVCRRRIRACLLPWVLVSLWMIFGVFVHYSDTTSLFNQSSIPAPNATYVLHSGAEMYFSPNNTIFDDTLQSELPNFLEAQLVPLAIFGIGYMILKVYRRSAK